jgi:hypothetical protein
MPRMAQFILTLIVGLALLTWAATNVVQTTAREWFERDVSARAQLVLVGASQALANSWYADSAVIQKQLIELSRDERVIGASVLQVFQTNFNVRLLDVECELSMRLTALTAAFSPGTPLHRCLPGASTSASCPLPIRTRISAMQSWFTI